MNLVTGTGAPSAMPSSRTPTSGSSASPATLRRVATSPATPPAGSSVSAWSSAARTGSSSWPMPISTWRPTGSSGRRSGRPASAALQPAASSSTGRSSLRSSTASPRGPGPSASVTASSRRPTSARSSTPPPARRSRDISRWAVAIPSSSSAVRDDRATARAWLLPRADDLHRRPPDGPPRPGGDLRATPVGHPGRRLCGGRDGPQPDTLRPLVEHLHAATRTRPSGRCATSRPGSST